MFDNNVFKKDTCKNFSIDDEVKGYELETLITYYRGIPLSMIEHVQLIVDGNVELAPIYVSIDQEDWFTLDEITTVVDYKWEYGDSLYIRVMKDGGLSKGEHEVTLKIAVRTAYIPVPLAGEKTRAIVI